MEITVDEYTSPILITVEPNANLDEALELMQGNGIRHLPVLENGKILGIISERDLLFHVGKDWCRMMVVRDIMQEDILTVQRNDDLGEVAYLLSSGKVGSAIVLEDDRPYGIFTTTDALNALVDLGQENYIHS